MDPTQAQDPSQDAAPDDDSQDQDQGYTIEIKVAGDGSMTYSVEPGSEEAEEEGGEGAEPSGTPVKSLADLIAKIKETIQNGGASPETSDAQFKAGLSEDE